MSATVSSSVCIVRRILHICPPLRSNEFLCRSAVRPPSPDPLPFPATTANFMLGVIRIGRTRHRMYPCLHLCSLFCQLQCTPFMGAGKDCRLRSLEPRTKQCQNTPLKVKGRSRSMRTTQRSFSPRRLAKTSRAATEKPRRFVSSSPSFHDSLKSSLTVVAELDTCVRHGRK